jgi:hypothetical protein
MSSGHCSVLLTCPLVVSHWIFIGACRHAAAALIGIGKEQSGLFFLIPSSPYTFCTFLLENLISSTLHKLSPHHCGEMTMTQTLNGIAFGARNSITHSFFFPTCASCTEQQRLQDGARPDGPDPNCPRAKLLPILSHWPSGGAFTGMRAPPRPTLAVAFAQRCKCKPGPCLVPSHLRAGGLVSYVVAPRPHCHCPVCRRARAAGGMWVA